jgi:hypothetical protein
MTTVEPPGPDGRQADVTDRSFHEAHETLGIAALAAGDLSGAERDRAEALVAACSSCRSLYADLLVLADATRMSPPAVPWRPRDFTLSERDAARLSSRSRRVIDWLAGPRGAMTRPLAAGLATLGVAVIVLSSASLPFASTAGRPAEDAGAVPREMTPQSAPVPGAAGVPEFGPTDNMASPAASPSAGASTADKAGRTDTQGLTQEEASLAPSTIIGIALLGAGVVVISLRPIARRLS